MRKNFILIAIMSLIVFFHAEASIASTKVIYGIDNRVDTYASSDSLFVELANSTAAMVPASNLLLTQDGVLLGGSSLEDRGICSSERFSKQLTAANCSGFLVGKNLLVTAGHCVKSQRDCDRYRWVFDYTVESEDQTWALVDVSDVYNCKRIVQTVLSNKDDWALIELDREAVDRRPLQYRHKGKPSVGDPLVVIGHPSGLPQKIADGSHIRKLNTKYFTADLDTYGGNSGSAVFNSRTGIVEGILVRGATDYVYDSSQGCRVSNVLSQNAGRGEDVTYITNIPQL